MPRTKEEILKEIQDTGHIPPEFMAEWDLADPELPAAKTATAYLKKISDRLLAAEGIDPNYRPFHFFLSNDTHASAYILPHLNEPIIVLSKGLIRLLDYEDEIAAILRHEIQHYNLNDYSNSKAQEEACDLASVGSLKLASYNPLALASVLRKLPDWEKNWKAHFEVHPDRPHRIRDVESWATIKDRKEGDSNKEWTAIDERVKAVVGEIPQPEGSLARWLEEQDYDVQPAAEKIRILDKFFRTEADLPDAFTGAKRGAFISAISALSINSQDSAQKDALDDFVDHILAARPSLREFYRSLPGAEVQSHFQIDRKVRPLGQLVRLDDYIKHFLEAKTPDQAELFAYTINKIASGYNLGPHQSLSFSFPAIEGAVKAYEDSGGMRRVWKPHIEWAKADQTNNIRHALQCLGFGRDTFMPPMTEAEMKSVEVIFKHSESFLASISNSVREYVSSFNNRHHLKKESAGERDGSLQEEGRRIAVERQRLAAKDQAEALLLQKVDWNELETDFVGFIDKYNEFLTPEITMCAQGGDTFAAEFLRRLVGLVEQDKNAHLDKLKVFFEGSHWDYPPDPKRKMIKDLSQRIDNLSSANKLGHHENFWFSPRMGIPASHPFVEFVLSDPYGLCSPLLKETLVSRTAFLNVRKLDAPLADQLFIQPNRVFKDFSEEPTIENLLSQTLMGGGRYQRYVAESLMFRTLTAHPDAVLPVKQMYRLRVLADGMKNDMTDGTKELVARQIARNTEYELRPEATAQEIAETYVAYSITSSFAHSDELRSRYEEAIKARVGEADGLEAREKLTETLLYRHSYNSVTGTIEPAVGLASDYTGRIPDHEFRAWANKLLVDSVKDRLGLDDNSADYFLRITAKVEEISQETKENQTIYEALPALADAINAQPATAFMIRDARIKRGLSISSLSTHVGAVVEISLSEIAKNSDLRFAAIDFLTSPISKASALNFGSMADAIIADRLLAEAGIYVKDDNAQRVTDRYVRIHQEFWRAPFEARAWYLDKVLFPPSDENEEKFEAACALVMDKAFPGDATTAKMERQLIDLRVRQREASRKRQSAEIWGGFYEISEKMTDMRLDFPVNLEPGSKEGRKYARRLRSFKRQRMMLRVADKRQEIMGEFREEVVSVCDRAKSYLSRVAGFTKEASVIMRQIAVAYLDTIGPHEKRLALSAIMAARSMSYEDQKKGKETSPGKFAAQVLGYMDEMGGKVLQAIDSHPAVPEDIKKDLGDAKGNYQKPYRWDAIEWSMDHGIVAQEPGSEIAHYGPVIGSGSMGYTLLVQTADGQEFADTLLRPHAQVRSEREASNVVSAAQKLAAMNPKLAVAPDIAAVAQRDARIETQMGLAYKQGLVAAQVYNGLKTSAVVNGKKYSFIHRTADITDFSAGGKRAALVQGEHFKDLPEVTQEQRDYKKATAVQLYGTEIFNILTGKPCDRDRHGKNQKVAPGQINHFDFGMTALVLPTVEQKREMIKIVMTALRDSFFFRKDISASFDRQIRKVQASTETKQYLSGFRRQILSLGDFDKYLTVEDKKQILASVFGSGRICPVIREQIEATKFGRITVKRLAKTDASLFLIDDSQCVQHIQMPELTGDELSLIRGNMPPEARRVAPVANQTTRALSKTPSKIRRDIDSLMRSHAAALFGSVRPAALDGGLEHSPRPA